MRVEGGGRSSEKKAISLFAGKFCRHKEREGKNEIDLMLERMRFSVVSPHCL